MKKWLAIIVGTLLAIILVVAGIGALLPADHVATRSVQISAPPSDVWAVVADFEHQATWRDDVERVERVAAADGRELWREHYEGGDALTFETRTAEPPSRLVRAIADPDAPFSGTWEYTIEPAAPGSRVTIVERGTVPNPIFRFMSRFVFGHTSGMDTYLSALSRRFGGSAGA